jgi:soluble lytic murein transglycosylase
MGLNRNSLGILAFFLVAFHGPPGSSAWMGRTPPRSGSGNVLAQAVERRDSTDSSSWDLSVGRYWHASVRLREELGDLSQAEPRRILELAEAEGGWGNWPAVTVLLAGAAWLDEVRAGAGWGLLARAQAEAGAWEAADSAYGRYLGLSSGRAAEEVAAARIRRGIVLARLGEMRDALVEVDRLAQEASAPFASWAALEVVRAAAEGEADPVDLEAAVARISEPGATAPAKRILGMALLGAGDTVGAEIVLREAIPGTSSAAARAEMLNRLGALRLAQDDSAGARDWFSRSMEEASSRGGVTAAAHLLELGPASQEEALRVARVLRSGGRAESATEAFEIYFGLLDAEEATEDIRLDRARAWASSGRVSDAADELVALSRSEDADLAGAALALLMSLRRRQGRDAEAARLQEELITRFPSRPEAVEAVFFRGDAAHDRGQLQEALEHYREASSMAPSSNRAGLARMRMGQIYVRRGDWALAARVYEEYLRDFPDGRRWDEAAFWAARSLLASGEAEPASTYLDRLRWEAPFSYYGVMAYRLTDEPYEPEPEPAPMPRQFFPWVEGGLRRLDVMLAAGLEDGAAAEIDEILSRAGGLVGARLQLAEGLIERGLTWRGINLGWELQGEGHPRDLRLLRIIYPFPYREQIEREAIERGLDPYLMAALIRQESAFWARAVSSAGAVGLMQVMPATGRGLARRIGPDGFSTASLETPDVNLHLGSAFLADMLARYEADLNLVLVAYNAGPSRANRWRSLPEATDPLRFVERIPFAETRGFVKNVTRNLEIYRWLYGRNREGAEPD